ncbi:hypothetical protein DFQ28_007918 [Apophysomyces sp. BC1034]|nr:hypothetical protein DFQ29_006631 [Apophysomyces sp. BC1021]KAG0186402.1 hypothetical protein DFQ28_007918 [Apophysomyces sp. BC1034]
MPRPSSCPQFRIPNQHQNQNANPLVPETLLPNGDHIAPGDRPKLGQILAIGHPPSVPEHLVSVSVWQIILPGHSTPSRPIHLPLCPLSDLRHQKRHSRPFSGSLSSQWKVWQTVWREYFSTDPAPYDVLTRLRDPPQDNIAQKPTSAQVTSSILLSIWNAHWRFIFDETPFVAPIVADRALILAAAFKREQEGLD